MSTPSICEHFVRFRPVSAAFALAFGLGTILAPSVGFGQDQKQAQSATPELMAIDLPTAVCQNNPLLRELCGDDVVLARSVKLSPEHEDHRVKIFGKPGSHQRERPKDGEMDVRVKGDNDPNTDYIEVKVTLSKEFLRRFNPNDPKLTFYTVSVVGKTGSASCYWDCYYVNGKKICECIEG